MVPSVFSNVPDELIVKLTRVTTGVLFRWEIFSRDNLSDSAYSAHCGGRLCQNWDHNRAEEIIEHIQLRN